MCNFSNKKKILFFGVLLTFLSVGQVVASSTSDPSALFGADVKTPSVSIRIYNFFNSIKEGLSSILNKPSEANSIPVVQAPVYVPKAVPTTITIVTNTPHTVGSVKGVSTTSYTSTTSILSTLKQLLSQKQYVDLLRGPTGAQGEKGESGPIGNSAMYPSQLALSTQRPNSPAPIPSVFMPVGVSQPNPLVNFSGATFFNASDLSSRYFKTSEANIGTLTVTGESTLSGNLTVIGNITGNILGTINPSFTVGSIPFQGLTGLAQDNTNFFWDDTTNRLGIGTTTPGSRLTIGSGQVELPIGSEASPSLVFSGELDTGIYSDTTGSLSIAADGNQTLIVRNGTVYSKDLNPFTGGTYDLGGAGNQWKYSYFLGSNINVSNTTSTGVLGIGNGGGTPTVSLNGNTNGDSYFNTGGKVGIGDTTPASLFTVGSGDLFQVHSTGQIGSQVAPTSDYLFSLAGTTGNDNSRILSITQANDSDESSSAITISATPTLGTIAGSRQIYGINTSLTPSFTSSDDTVGSVYGSLITINSSNITLGDSTSNTVDAEISGNFANITGNPVFNDTVGADQSRIIAYGFQSNLVITPTLTSVLDGQIFTAGGEFYNGTSSGGNANLQSLVYGIRAQTSGNLTTTGDTVHYGGYFNASGTADTNYGLYATVSGGTNNYAAIFEQGFVGIQNTTPGYALHVGSSSVTDSTVLLRLQDANSTCDFTADTGAPSCGSDLTLKKDISSLNTGDLLTKISALNPVSYRWLTEDSSSPLQNGFIAQEVAEQFPELVTDHIWIDGTTKKFLNMGGLMPYTIGAIKELDIKVSGLSSFDMTNSNSLGSLIKQFLANANNGLESLFVKKIRTEELCVKKSDGNDVCINGDQLQQLLGGSSSNTNSDTSSESASTTGSTGDSMDGEGDIGSDIGDAELPPE